MEVAIQQDWKTKFQIDIDQIKDISFRCLFFIAYRSILDPSRNEPIMQKGITVKAKRSHSLFGERCIEGASEKNALIDQDFRGVKVPLKDLSKFLLKSGNGA